MARKLKRTTAGYGKIGATKRNKQGDKMQIIAYRNANDVDVKFLEPRECIIEHRACADFNAGTIKNPYHPEVCGVACVGQKYPTTQNGKMLKEYQAWRDMIRRTNEKASKQKRKTYRRAKVAKEWLCYENFVDWVRSQSNYEHWKNGDGWAVDKDILVKGNKLYSPETCSLVSPNINILFVKADKGRGEYPIGVSFRPDVGKFRAMCTDGTGKMVYLGYHETPEEAFYAYKAYKEALIQRKAQEAYDKGEITQRCYEAMMSYEVEITD